MADSKAYLSRTIFDGERLHEGKAVLVDDCRVAGLVPIGDIPASYERVDLGGGVLAPGLIDLQVNGGGGLMLGEIGGVGDLARICAAHVKLGTTSLLPTLITDTRENTARVLAIAGEATKQILPGFQGLHLEGPHLDVTKKGAHDAALIRPMDAADLDAYLKAAETLPSLMITVAPEAVTLDQISQLSKAGIIVSLGHSNASYESALKAAAAGATCVTHLFNAMSPLGHREPGMVGAALNSEKLNAGLIADGIHVDPTAITVALRAKSGPGAIFLVTDAMAVAGTDLTEFELGGRKILRGAGRLTLEDGTLAGADIDLPGEIRFLRETVGLSLDAALAMATSSPANVLGKGRELGVLSPDSRADMVYLEPEGTVGGVWTGGKRHA